MKNKKPITTAIIVVVMLFMGFAACKDKKPKILDLDLSETKQDIPTIRTDSVTTIISDSGVTRYRLTAPSWLYFDKADSPYWEFPKGLRIERFNTDLSVDAKIHADYGKYFTEREFWELFGNVDATNLEGERFQTQRLFWSQKNEEIYSDTLVKITQTNNTIYGTNFKSDQTLSKYSIKQGTGDFLIPEE